MVVEQKKKKNITVPVCLASFQPYMLQHAPPCKVGSLLNANTEVVFTLSEVTITLCAT